MCAIGERHRCASSLPVATAVPGMAMPGIECLMTTAKRPMNGRAFS
jgi:hypothetical protein